MTDNALCNDLLVGAQAVAEEIFGSSARKDVMRVRHLARTRAIPTTMFGGKIATTKSALREHFASKLAAK